MEWKLAEAKNKFSELIRRVRTDGPQWIRLRNDAFVVISEREYRALRGECPTLKRQILDGPDLTGVELERARDPLREVDL